MPAALSLTQDVKRTLHSKREASEAVGINHNGRQLLAVLDHESSFRANETLPVDLDASQVRESAE